VVVGHPVCVKVVADIYCKSVLAGWRSSKWWGQDDEEMRREKEEEFIKRNGGSDFEINERYSANYYGIQRTPGR
jgi:hypothetical protein